MERSFSKNPFVSEEENESSQETGPESPPSSTFNDMKPISSPSAKRSRRSIQKRVVSVPMKDVESSRLKGDTAPPSDSWAWRKYGQKPIKGSPYPRGYYRCSSSKGCPARKQVERSRDDPTMILITYTCDHNHPWPASRNPHHKHHPKPEPEPEPQPEREREPEPEPEPDHQEDKFMDLGEIETTSSLILNGDSTGAASACHVDEFAWFGEMETTSSTILDSPIFSEKKTTAAEMSPADADVAMFFPMREEDESLFADLGELPECSVVFRHRSVGSRVEIC